MVAATPRWQGPLLILLVANILRFAYFDLVHTSSCDSITNRQSQPAITGSGAHGEELNNVAVVDSAELPLHLEEINPSRYIHAWNSPYKSASELVQGLLASRQSCTAKSKRILRLRTLQGSSLLSNIVRIARTLVLVTANADDIVVSVSFLPLPATMATQSCSDFLCMFEPLEACASRALDEFSLEISEGPERECETSKRVKSLRKKAGLEDAKFDFVDEEFFVQEALRFLMRPTRALMSEITALRNQVVPPSSQWRPYKGCCARIGLHIRDPKYDLNKRTIRLARIYASSYGAGGVSDVLIKANANTFDKASNLWKGASTENERDFLAKTRDSLTIRSVSPELAGNRSPALALLAQAYVLAEADFIVGEGPSNFFRFVAALMRNQRYTKVVPAFDALGDVLPEPGFNPDGVDD